MALALLLAVGMAGASLAQPTPDAEARQIGSETLERYEVVVLRSGLLLSPREEEEGLSAIELDEDGVALDGLLVDESELRDRLGDVEAELVLSLVGLDMEVRKALFLPETEPSPEADTGEETMAVEADEPVLEDPDEEVGYEESLVEDELAAEEEREEKRAERHKRRSRHLDSKVVVGERVVVERDESYGEVVVFGNDLEIYGEVRGDAAAIGGSVKVYGGEVTGSVSAIGGSVYLEDGAEVMGEVVSVGGEVEMDDDVVVRGDIVEVPFVPSLRIGNWPTMGWDKGQWHGDADFFDFSPFRMVTRAAWKFFGLVLVALMACLVLLLARRPLERVERRVVAEPWKSGLVGLVAQVLFVPFLVLVVVVLAISIIGIPLLLLVPFAILALVIVAFLGYTAVALQVGRIFERRVGWKLDSPYLTLIVGVLLIEILCLVGDLMDFGWGPVWFFAAMFTIFGILVEYIVWTVGFGAALLTRFGTSEGWRGAAGGGLPPVPPAPPVDDLGPIDIEASPALEAPAWQDDSIFEGESFGGSAAADAEESGEPAVESDEDGSPEATSKPE